MKKVLFTIMLFVLGLGLMGCKSHVRELPIKDTLIYCDCARYDTIPSWDIKNDNPDYVVCTNRYTNEEETMVWEDYLKSNDINIFIQDLLDDLDDEFMFLENDIATLQEQLNELQGTLYTQELAMTEALYEAKLDWYELQYNIDFDDVPNEFILWLMEEHPDVYEYFSERE